MLLLGVLLATLLLEELGLVKLDSVQNIVSMGEFTVVSRRLVEVWKVRTGGCWGEGGGVMCGVWKRG